MSDTPKNSRQTAADIDRLFRSDEDLSSVSPGGYEDPSGAPKPTRGDDDAPWVKTPPFSTAPTVWVSELPIPRLLAPADYLALPTLECFQERLLQIYFELTITDAGNDMCQLSLIPEGFAQGNPYIASVVDPTMTAFVPGASARFPFTLGSRTFAPSELRTPSFVIVGGGIIRFLLTFDIAPYESFRLNIRDLTGTGATTLRALYAFSR